MIVTQQKVRRASVKRTLLTCFHTFPHPKKSYRPLATVSLVKKRLYRQNQTNSMVIKELWFWTLSSAVDSIFTILHQTFKIIKNILVEMLHHEHQITLSLPWEKSRSVKISPGVAANCSSVDFHRKSNQWLALDKPMLSFFFFQITATDKLIFHWC